MVFDLQFWANIVQLASLPLTLFSLIISLLIWFFPAPQAMLPFVVKIRPYATLVTIALISFLAGLFMSRPASDTVDTSVLLQKDMPFEAFSYGGRPEDAGFGKVQSDLAVFNYEDANNPSYRLICNLPEEEDGACGLQFEFYNPQDIRRFDYLSFSIQYDRNAPKYFYLNIRDNDERWHSLKIDETELPDDIALSVEGSVRRIKIPLETYFPELNNKFVESFSFLINTEGVRGETIVVFRDIEYFVSK